MTKATIFSVTQPVVNTQGEYEPKHELRMTAEESIVYQARVSSPKQRTEDSQKLLHYLVKHGHWSPFDMADLTVEIETTRAIMPQVLRHWSFRFQEFSQRYAEVENFDFSDLEMRKAGSTNRQASGGVWHVASKYALESANASSSVYQELVAKGDDALEIATESARAILPLCTPTRAYMKGSVRSWMTYFWQRLAETTQKEHRVLAQLCFVEFQKQFPEIAELVQTHRPSIVPSEPFPLDLV